MTDEGQTIPSHDPDPDLPTPPPQPTRKAESVPDPVPIPEPPAPPIDARSAPDSATLVAPVTPAPPPPPSVPSQNGWVWDGTQWVPDPALSSPVVVNVNERPPSTANPAWVIIAWLVAIVTFGYMLPWAIAASRGMPNQLAIGLVNFLLGWTIVGWIVALVMAAAQKR